MRNPAGTPPRSGGRILIDQLVLHGVEVIFGVPGESYLAALDALRDSPIRFVNARHEAGAANMAEAAGKLTGRPGVCFVTRGPGAAHGCVGVHTAFQDSTPLIYLVGQVPRAELGREALQEVDFEAMFAPLAKWTVQIDDPARIPEILQRAFAVATCGRPGPVVVALPEDVLAAVASTADARPHRPSLARPAAADLAAVRDRLARASSPLLIVGGGGWSEQAASDARAFAEASALPVACAFRCQDYLDSRSRSYVGHLTTHSDPALAARVRDADVLLVVGDRLGDVTTGGYTLLEAPQPRQALIHVYPEARELGRVFAPELALVSDSGAFFAAIEPVDGAAWATSSAQAREEFLAWSRPAAGPWQLDLATVVSQTAERLAGEAILVDDAGNFSAWVSRFMPFHHYRSQLMPVSGAMGYAVPAAVAAKLLRPQRQVVAFVGDGGFQMSALELATAAQEGVAIVVIVVNNGMYGTIRMFQERRYPGREMATALRNPDFAALARACGAHGETVERTEQFLPALERALAQPRAAVLDLHVDAEAITPVETISQIRAAAQAG
ncbi:MAG TPA: thiamine pyrophosphate-dependent enzyme [Solirubrobacteraceae bacterium]|nr:thiamine pyrophosphate-dependent enzyme [Solirubrobacteraceae bacterium]